MFEDDIFLEDVADTLAAQHEACAPERLAVHLRSVEAVDSIYNGRGLLSAPVAGIYRVEYTDGSNAEVLVMGTPNNRNFHSARFLEKGRSSDQLNQVLKLIVRNAKGHVPEDIKEYLLAYEAERDMVYRQRLYG